MRFRHAQGQPGVAVDGGVQMGVAAAVASAYGVGDLPVLIASFAVDTPSAAVGDDTGLLHVQVHHVYWPLGEDSARCAVASSGRVEEPAAVQRLVHYHAGTRWTPMSKSCTTETNGWGWKSAASWSVIAVTWPRFMVTFH